MIVICNDEIIACKGNAEARNYVDSTNIKDIRYKICNSYAIIQH